MKCVLLGGRAHGYVFTFDKPPPEIHIPVVAGLGPVLAGGLARETIHETHEYKPALVSRDQLTYCYTLDGDPWTYLNTLTLSYPGHIAIEGAPK